MDLAHRYFNANYFDYGPLPNTGYVSKEHLADALSWAQPQAQA